MIQCPECNGFKNECGVQSCTCGDLPDGLIAVGVPDGYEGYFQILLAALDQTSRGKGKERHHTDGEAFEQQQITEIAHRLGDNSGPLYQAVKKIYESKRLDPSAAVRELLGSINYTVAAIMVLLDSSDASL